MAKYIDCDAFIAEKRMHYCAACKRRQGMKNGKMQFCYEIGDAPCRACDVADMLDYIEDFPAADVRPVVHGMWVRNEYGVIHCSVCNAYLKDEEYENHTFKKCYYCGADMREVDDG